VGPSRLQDGLAEGAPHPVQTNHAGYAAPLCTNIPERDQFGSESNKLGASTQLMWEFPCLSPVK